MKKLAIALTLVTLNLTQPVYAQGWFDSLKNMLGLGSTTEEVKQPSMTEMVKSVTNGLGITSKQAEGGLASIFNYVKNNVSDDQFKQLSGTLPGMDGVLKSLPAISGEGSNGLSGLIDKAAEYNESLKAINTVKKQFEALGLKPEMITGFVDQVKTYLDTEQGKEAQKLFVDGLGKLLG